MAESNRDKAARGGWGLGAAAGLSFDHGGRPIEPRDREQQIHETAQTMAATGLCSYPDARDAIAQMMVPPLQAVAALDVPANPQPAPSQVWVPPEGDLMACNVACEGTLTVRDVDPTPRGTFVHFVEGGYAMDDLMVSAERGWRCIGVATEYGRVMEGDGFQTGAGYPVTISAVSPNAGSVIVRWADGGEVCNRAEMIAAWTRTRYAPARVGERYAFRREPRTVQIVRDRQWMLLREEDGRDLYALNAGGSLNPALWERLDPSTASHAVAPVPRANDAARAFMRLYEDRERIIADASLPTATGAGLDGLASTVFGIERKGSKGSAYRSATEAESDESFRARCVAKLGALPRAGDMGDGVSAVHARESDDGRIAVSGRSGTSLNFTIEATVSTKGFEGAALAFTRVHDALPKPAPADAARARRDEVRRAIDSAISADKGQPFAHARAAALHAWAETLYSGDTVADVAAVHAGLLRYEALRGSRREPSLAAMDVGVPETARAMYERERAGKRVAVVTPREEPARPTGGASLNGWQTAAHFWERWSR